MLAKEKLLNHYEMGQRDSKLQYEKGQCGRKKFQSVLFSYINTHIYMHAYIHRGFSGHLFLPSKK